MKQTAPKPKVVVIGGGTGTFPVVVGLKRQHVALSTVIAVSDSGGSTGRIRDEFGFQPVGDLRQSLAALATADGEEWIRKILLYRFDKGQGLQGHNLGNLLLTALQDMTGDTAQALEIAERVFRLDGQVIPVTKENVQLEIHYQDGGTAVGEHILDQTPDQPRQISHITLQPPASIHPAAQKALLEADLIVIGPGDYYASLLACLVPEGMAATLQKTKAQVVYNVNLMTRLTQTHNMTAQDHVRGIERVIGRKIDWVVLNSQSISAHVLAAYQQEHEFPVRDDLGQEKRVVRAALLSDEVFIKPEHDTAHRSLLRHDPNKIGQVLYQLLK
jgi:uncharacterized cofD-like protein